MLQNSTLWTWQETFEFCEIRKISWPSPSLPDSQDINFTESDHYLLITTTVIVAAIIIIIIIIIITREKIIYIHMYWKLKVNCRSHSVETLFWKRLWTCRKSVHRMNDIGFVIRRCDNNKPGNRGCDVKINSNELWRRRCHSMESSVVTPQTNQALWQAGCDNRNGGLTVSRARSFAVTMENPVPPDQTPRALYKSEAYCSLMR
jgi:hypothetical protein